MNNKSALINNDKIELSFEYDMDIIQVVRNIQGREWNKPKHPGVWTVPVSQWHMQQVVKLMKPMGFYIDPEIVQGAKGSAAKPPKLNLPDGLYDYQQMGVKFIYATGGRCIVADEMGLGKTAQALVFMNQFCGKTLIVTPASVLYKWATKECALWAPDKKVQIVTKGKQELEADADIILMSYALMVAKYATLARTPFNCVIFDEAHYLKSPKSQRGRMAKALVKAGIPHVLFLSGTPYMNRPTELFPLLHMLDSQTYGNFYHYAARYCGWQYMNGMWMKPDKDVVTNASELAERIQTLMLRRTKKDVALELPELTRSIVPVQIDNMGDYRLALSDLQAWLALQDKTALNPEHVLTRLNALRQIVGRGKVEAAVELVEDILESDEKVVLFAHHKDVVAQLIKALMKYGVGVIVGDTPVKERQRQVELFLSNETLISQKPMRVMIISVAGAEGIDLYQANQIVFVEREWVPAIEEQAEARLHRIGQKNPVTAHYLVALGTVDEKLNNLVSEKRKLFSSVIRQDEIITRLMETIE